MFKSARCPFNLLTKTRVKMATPKSHQVSESYKLLKEIYTVGVNRLLATFFQSLCYDSHWFQCTNSAQEHSLSNVLVNRLCTNRKQKVNRNIRQPFQSGFFLLCTKKCVLFAVMYITKHISLTFTSIHRNTSWFMIMSSPCHPRISSSHTRSQG